MNPQNTLLRQTLTLMLPITLAFVVGIGLLLQQVISAHHEQSRGRLLENARALALTYGDGFNRFNEGIQQLATLRSYERVWIVSEGGEVVLSNHAPEIGTPLTADMQAVLTEVHRPAEIRTMAYQGQELIVAAYWNDAVKHWAVVLQRAELAGSIVWKILGILFFGLLGWAATAAVIYFQLQAMTVQPVRRILAVAERLRQGEPITDATLDRLRAESNKHMGALGEIFITLAHEQQHLRAGMQEATRVQRLLLDMVPEFALVVSSDGRVLEITHRLCMRLGITRAWAVGHPADRLQPYLPLEAIFALGQRSQHEQCTFSDLDFDLATQEGQVLPVRASVQALHFQGEAAILWIAEDRSETQALQQQLGQYADSVELMIEERTASLRQSVAAMEQQMAAAQGEQGRQSQEVQVLRRRIGEARVLMNLIEQASGMVVVFDHRGHTIRWNQQAEAISGYTHAHVVNQQRFLARLFPAPHARQAFSSWLVGAAEPKVFNAAIHTEGGGSTAVAWVKSYAESEQQKALLLLIGIPASAVQAVAPAGPPPVALLEAPTASQAKPPPEPPKPPPPEQPLRVENPASAIHLFERPVSAASQEAVAGRHAAAVRQLRHRLGLLTSLGGGEGVHAAAQRVDMDTLFREALAQATPPGERQPFRVKKEADLPPAMGNRVLLLQTVMRGLEYVLLAHPKPTIALHLRAFAEATQVRYRMAIEEFDGVTDAEAFPPALQAGTALVARLNGDLRFEQEPGGPWTLILTLPAAVPTEAPAVVTPDSLETG